eukprot:414906_1
MSSRDLTRSNSGKYRRISIELEEPPDTALHHTNTVSKSSIKNNNLHVSKTLSKPPKSIPNDSSNSHTSIATLENNSSHTQSNKNNMNTTSDSDTDNTFDESKTEDEDLTPL